MVWIMRLTIDVQWVPTIRSIVQYLSFKGYVYVDDIEYTGYLANLICFKHPDMDLNTKPVIQVLRYNHFSDYELRTLETIRQISEFEKRSEYEVYHDIYIVAALGDKEKEAADLLTQLAQENGEYSNDRKV